MGLPFKVYRGHYRTSTYLADTVRTLANIVDNFKSGETYNIGGGELDSIEELAEIVLRVTGADRSQVQYCESEKMTTKVKRVDITKAVQDLGHENTCSLEEGMRLTSEWMRSVYKRA
jgi:dTDP-glucose 4,6-dehydratase